MKVLVLGCDGYIGTVLVQKLLADGHSVVGVDNEHRRKNVNEMGSFSAMPIKSAKKKNEAYLRAGGAWNYYKFDIAKKSPDLEHLMDIFKPDAIVNLAHQPSAPFSQKGHKKSIYTLRNNTDGTLNVLYGIKEVCPETHLVQLGCYDTQTEALTEDGWKFFKDITLEDKILCLNKDDKTSKFYHPERLVNKLYEGKMLQIKSKSVDALLTPNHRNVYDWKGTEQECFVVPGCHVRWHAGSLHFKEDVKVKMNSWLNFFGIYLADGTIVRKGGLPTAVRITVKKQRKKDFIQTIIDDKDFPFHISVHNTKTGYTSYEIAENQLAAYLDTFGTARSKCIPKELKALSKDQLKVLLHSILMGDGSKTQNNDAYMFTSFSSRLLDDVQEVALKCGYMSSKIKDCESITLASLRDKDLIKQKHMNWVDYNDFIYCATVPTGIMMVRRNGKTYWSGNTMGEFSPAINVDIPDGGLFQFEYNGRTSSPCLFPRAGGSLYHSSKIASTVLVDFACRSWKVTATDIMQGVLYGNWSEEIEQSGINTRLDSDECLPPGSMIMTQLGYKPIEEIEVGMKVFSHTGVLRDVTKTFDRIYNGKMIKVDYQFSKTPLEGTPNHPVLIVEKNREYENGNPVYRLSQPRWTTLNELSELSKQKKSQYGNYEKIIDDYNSAVCLRKLGKTYSEISEALNVKYTTITSWLSKKQKPLISLNKRTFTDDIYLLVPRLKSESKDLAIDIFDTIEYGIKAGKMIFTPNSNNSTEIWGEPLENKIKVTESLMRVFGYFIAEGHASNYMLGFSFGPEEQDYVNDLSECFSKSGLAKVVNNYKDDCKLSVHSIILSKLFKKLFNGNSHTMRIPDWFFDLDDNMIKNLIQCYWRGDGCYSNGLVSFTSVSKTLMEQIQILLLRFGIFGNITYRKRHQTLKFKGREPYEFDSETYEMIVSGNDARVFMRIFENEDIEEPKRKVRRKHLLDDYIALPIKSVSDYNYSGHVHNLEVDIDESYLTPVVVHNCFGTALNRFIVQALIGSPLTIFGTGVHKRGFLAVSDAVQCIMLAIQNPPKQGEYRAWNQLDQVYSMNECADMVISVAKEFGIDAQKSYIESPRVECLSDHYYNPIVTKLPDLGFKPQSTVEKEVRWIFSKLINDNRVKRLESVVTPRLKWSRILMSIRTTHET